MTQPIISPSRQIKLKAAIFDLKRQSAQSIITASKIKETLSRHGLAYEKLSPLELTFFNANFQIKPLTY